MSRLTERIYSLTWLSEKLLMEAADSSNSRLALANVFANYCWVYFWAELDGLFFLCLGDIQLLVRLLCPAVAVLLDAELIESGVTICDRDVRSVDAPFFLIPVDCVSYCY